MTDFVIGIIKTAENDLLRYLGSASTIKTCVMIHPAALLVQRILGVILLKWGWFIKKKMELEPTKINETIQKCAYLFTSFGDLILIFKKLSSPNVQNLTIPTLEDVDCVDIDSFLDHKFVSKYATETFAALYFFKIKKSLHYLPEFSCNLENCVFTHTDLTTLVNKNSHYPILCRFFQKFESRLLRILGFTNIFSQEVFDTFLDLITDNNNYVSVSQGQFEIFFFNSLNSKANNPIITMINTDGYGFCYIKRYFNPVVSENN